MSEKEAVRLQIAICDDDEADNCTVTEMAAEILSNEGQRFHLTSYASAQALLAAIEAGAEFHILLLDVMMPELNGMQLAEALRAKENHTTIIFISSNRDMALRGYEVEATRYLAKPVQREQLREALSYCSRSGTAKKEILLPTPKGQSRVQLAAILYAEPWERNVRLCLTDGALETTLRLSDLAKLLPGHQFVYCHRTILVNLDHVKSLHYRELELSSGQTLPVSKYRMEAVRLDLMHYLES